MARQWTPSWHFVRALAGGERGGGRGSEDWQALCRMGPRFTQARVFHAAWKPPAIPPNLQVRAGSIRRRSLHAESRITTLHILCPRLLHHCSKGVSRAQKGSRLAERGLCLGLLMAH